MIFGPGKLRKSPWEVLEKSLIFLWADGVRTLVLVTQGCLFALHDVYRSPKDVFWCSILCNGHLWMLKLALHDVFRPPRNLGCLLALHYMYLSPFAIYWPQWCVSVTREYFLFLHEVYRSPKDVYWLSIMCISHSKMYIISSWCVRSSKDVSLFSMICIGHPRMLIGILWSVLVVQGCLLTVHDVYWSTKNVYWLLQMCNGQW